MRRHFIFGRLCCDAIIQGELVSEDSLSDRILCEFEEPVIRVRGKSNISFDADIFYDLNHPAIFDVFSFGHATSIPVRDKSCYNDHTPR